MRGKVGSPVELTVRREGVAEAIKIKITRDVIRIQSVRSRVEGNGTVGYVRITTFNQNTEEGLKSAVEKIKKETGANLIGYVLDLRNNPGGLLDQAIAVSDAFLDKGEIVSTRGRDQKDIKRDNATPGDITNGLPVVILINGGSASASEIVSGALQDHRRAVLMGTRSFGKGSVQTVIPLPGHGAMRLTTARYFTPSGRSIQAKGIEPDIFVEQAKIEKITEAGFHEEDLRVLSPILTSRRKKHRKWLRHLLKPSRSMRKLASLSIQKTRMCCSTISLIALSIFCAASLSTNAKTSKGIRCWLFSGIGWIRTSRSGRSL